MEKQRETDIQNFTAQNHQTTAIKPAYYVQKKLKTSLKGFHKTGG